MDEVYQIHASSLAEYHAKERDDRGESLKEIGQSIIDYGLFDDLIYEQLSCEITYNIDDYLMLLNTYSKYIALDGSQRNYLLARLREALETNCTNGIKASYSSALHVAKKI